MVHASFRSEWFSTVQVLLKHYQSSSEYEKLIQNLCGNPLLTWELIQTHPDIPWDYTVLSSNPIITPAIVRDNSTKPWSKEELCANPSFHWDDLKPFIPFLYNNARLADNPNLSWEHLLEMLETEYDISEQQKDPVRTQFQYRAIFGKHVRQDYVSSKWFKKPFVTVDFVLANMAFVTNGYIYIDTISGNPTITWADVQANPDIPWSFIGLSSNPNITADILFANPNHDWHYYFSWKYPSITPEDIVRFIHLHRSSEKRDWLNVMATCFAHHPLLTADFVRQNWDLMKHYLSLISENPYLSAKTLREIWAIDSERWDHVQQVQAFAYTPRAPLGILKWILEEIPDSVTVSRFLLNPLTDAAREDYERRLYERRLCMAELWKHPLLPVDMIRQIVSYL